MSVSEGERAKLTLSAGAATTAVGFAEVPDFHVAVLRREFPDLLDSSILIGGDPAKRGKVVARSSDLGLRGIVPGMSLLDALVLAPGAKCVRTDLSRAREVSGLLRAAIRQELEAVEVDGLAGFYFRAPRDVDAAKRLVERLEARVRDGLQLPLRLGVAPVRFLARIAAEDSGVSSATVIGSEDFERYLLQQPVDRLPGVGPKTAARLAELGADRIPGLHALGLERLEILFGPQGRGLWLLACGLDPTALRVRRHPVTLSREETLVEQETTDLIREPKRNVDRIADSLSRISGSLEQALRRDGLRASRIALKLTCANQLTVTRSCSLPSPTAEASRLMAAAQELCGRAAVEDRLVRRACLVLKGLEISGAEDRQLDLF
jgi:nucleotidyltransferase/DNA polymerase involved in DNA repair